MNIYARSLIKRALIRLNCVLSFVVYIRCRTCYLGYEPNAPYKLSTFESLNKYKNLNLFFMLLIFPKSTQDLLENVGLSVERVFRPTVVYYVRSSIGRIYMEFIQA